MRFLPRCLETLQNTSYSPLELVVVDNNSHDGSLEYLRQHYPQIKLIELDENLGYSGAYNIAIPQTRGEFVVLLNFDVEVEADWLNQPIELLTREPRLAAVQPKLKSLQNRGMFEYSGGSGGFIDRYGYPFVRGRLFDTIEPDTGQYEDVRPIFWASGAAFITRRSAYMEAGGLDDDFFLHMEELDLCWRYWLLEWEVKVAPAGCVFHYAGAALAAERYHKMYYNHRNGLVMLLKNYDGTRLARFLPVRLLLDWVTVGMGLIRGQFKRAGAVMAAHAYVLWHLPTILAKRRRVQRMRRASDRELGRVIWPGSVVWRYFAKKQRTFSQLTVEW
ncbi:glycosyltransferase family 2 protein [bacterium]|nr:glycosyltransferase family 2 protein [bacterium]MBU1983923.1 glycosyltransferase family 2 protein [bacterium]